LLRLREKVSVGTCAGITGVVLLTHRSERRGGERQTTMSTTYSVKLASTGEVMIGVDGSKLEGLDEREAKTLARELEQTWKRELAGDSLEVVEE
jgi:hypothetical protein